MDKLEVNGLANQKAIFTSKEDFKRRFFDQFEMTPYIYHNGYDDFNTNPDWKYQFAWTGSEPTESDFKAGLRPKAIKLDGKRQLWWRNVGMPQGNKYMLSVWIKPTQADLDATWATIATNRGDGWGDRGIHLSLNNDSNVGSILNARVYGDSTSVNMFTDGSTNNGRKLFNFEADKWYHIVLIHDKSATYKVEVYINGEKYLWTGSNPNMNERGMSFTVGDNIGQDLPFHGQIQDVILSTDDNVFSEAQINEYYSGMVERRFLDDISEAGSLQLAKLDNGRYPEGTRSWYSKTIDLGTQFVEYGYIEAVGQIPSAASTNLAFFTRSSEDESTWEEWRQVDLDGKIQSTNTRFLQLRVDFMTEDNLLSPVLEEIRIMEDLIPIVIPDKPTTTIRSDEPLKLYHDLDSGLLSMGVVKNAFDLIIEEEINGEENLTFKLPKNDRKRKEIGEEPVEMVASLADRYFIVKQVVDKREGGNIYSEFTCEARWTELRDWYVDGIELVEVSARKALETIVSNVFREEDDPEFDWSIGHVEIERRRTIRSDWKDVLSLIREVQETWGGEILFDTKNKVIHLVQKIGKDSGVRFYYNKNLKQIERTIDSYDLVTRIYPQGKGGLDIKTVNNGVPYLENTKWVNKLKLRRKIIPYKWKDERYTVPENLLEDSQLMLDEMSKPNIKYSTTIHDLSALTGHEHESFDLGDTITAIDKELFDEDIINRIVRRKQDVRKPENTTVELAQPSKTLADIQSRALDDQIQTLIGSDPLSNSDVQQMTVFNQLLNSRADDGFNSWVHEADGTEFELANAGFSGSWSYKVTPQYGEDVSARLTQTVEGVSHRSTYTVSAAVATEGKITRGSSDNAFVGIKVLVYYEGEEQPEPFYLAVPDITDEE